MPLKLNKTLFSVNADLSIKPSVEISQLDINWAVSDSFYKNISSNSTFTFSNIIEGKSIDVVLKNTSISSISVIFPTAKTDSSYSGVISAGKESVFTFLRSNGNTYLAAIKDLT
jgi:hypothetical protein